MNNFSFIKRSTYCWIIYMDKNGQISKRKVKYLGETEKWMLAYCFLRKEKRIFIKDQILSISPIEKTKKSSVYA
ncbi:hypothetical protein RZN22_04330 [Bacillaceae bacterium S4-13-58]